MQGVSAVNTKLKTLIQALIDEVNEVKGEKDGSPQKAENWWKMVNWREPDMKSIYDSLSDGTKKLIADDGLCPDCPEKKEEKFPVAPKDENPPADPAPCTELLKKEHPDWSDEKIAETCEEAASIDEWDRFIDESVGKDAELTYKAKTGHPDEDYAYIDPDCKKENGKTPQKCRHLLIHDPTHVTAALAALMGARSGNPPPYADKAKPKVCAAAKKFKIESEVCGTAGKKKEDEVKPAKKKEVPDPRAVLERANRLVK